MKATVIEVDNETFKELGKPNHSFNCLTLQCIKGYFLKRLGISERSLDDKLSYLVFFANKFHAQKYARKVADFNGFYYIEIRNDREYLSDTDIEALEFVIEHFGDMSYEKLKKERNKHSDDFFKNPIFRSHPYNISRKIRKLSKEFYCG